jgi:hypothetical protein
VQLNSTITIKLIHSNKILKPKLPTTRKPIFRSTAVSQITKNKILRHLQEPRKAKKMNKLQKTKDFLWNAKTKNFLRPLDEQTNQRK